MTNARDDFGRATTFTRREAISTTARLGLGAAALGQFQRPIAAARADDDAAAAERARVLRGGRGTFNSPPRVGADKRVDIPRLLAELVDLGADTYHYLVYPEQHDWDDLKLFLPQARAKGLTVWASLCPPSEQKPIGGAYCEPFRLDFERWAVEFAKLSVAEPNLVAWSIDDFTHNLAFFTPEKMRAIVDGSRAINPRFAFAPCCYFPKITPAFIADYRDSVDGVLFPYRAESGKPNLTDASLVTEEIGRLRAIAGPSFPIILDVYATRHSTLGQSTPDYVRSVMADGWKTADAVQVYCHQDPHTETAKYNVIKDLFHEWPKRDR